MLEKIKGCFLGLAVGDALGVPVEFVTREFLTHNPVHSMTGHGTWSQPPGTWSDDSSLTFCLAESLLSKYDLHDIAARSVRWFKEGYWGAHYKVFDIGGTTRNALARLAAGIAPQFSGDHNEERNGNGSLMRIAPAALYFANASDDALYDRIKEVSSFTHAHFRSVFSCFYYSYFIRRLLNGDDKVSALYATGNAVEAFADLNDFNKREIKLFARLLDGSIVNASEHSLNSGGYVLGTLECAIWAFLTTDTFSQAVLRAVNLGGDADTTGCVTGALAGLYYGVEAIPVDWLNTLARYSDIVKLSGDFTQALKNSML